MSYVDHLGFDLQICLKFYLEKKKFLKKHVNSQINAIKELIFDPLII
jgi:hypothetical protein